MPSPGNPKTTCTFQSINASATISAVLKFSYSLIECDIDYIERYICTLTEMALFGVQS